MKRVILCLFILSLLAGLSLGEVLGAPADQAARPVPMIHVTDLFRPHQDPDDHWDLATVYALARQGEIDLKAVLIDAPPSGRPEMNPDIAAVAQLNCITALGVPVVTGSPHPMSSRRDGQPQASPSDHYGIAMILRLLRESDRPVVINVVGSCRDIAVAGNQAPELFARQCAGIYLNAGTGSPRPKPDAPLEYNVSLAPLSYAALFDIPCPIYWMPCFEDLGTEDRRVVREYGTHYLFQQGAILPHLSAPLQNYFLYMLSRKTDQHWLRTLSAEPDAGLLKTFGDQARHMWCTAGFLHAVGKTVNQQGEIVPLPGPPKEALCTFDPIEVSCSDDGRTRWRPQADATNRFIFHVRDLEHYQAGMTRALKTLLVGLP